MVEQSGELQAQFGIAQELRRDIGEQCALLQRGDQRLQAHGVPQSEEIQAADAETRSAG